MMAAPATALGLTLRVLVESDEAAAAAAAHQTVVGAADDVDAVLALVEGADVLTFEHEHVPAAVLAAVAARGVPVRPSAAALLHAQDKLAMRRRLTALGVPCPAWAPVPDAAALDAFLGEMAARWARMSPAEHQIWAQQGDRPGPREIFGSASLGVVKTTRGGYDGKGVRLVREAGDVADWLAAVADGSGPPLLVEQAVLFTRELAVQVARRPSGELRAWPVVESIQRDGVCSEVIAPAPDLHPETEAQALEVARTVAEGLDVVGVLAVELFEVPSVTGGPPQVLVNELAMRPHNSGHWTIDGSVTSQFEQHLRAVLDLPLGTTEARTPWSVMVNLLGSALPDLTAALPQALAVGCRRTPVDRPLAGEQDVPRDAKVHLYGKSVRPGRKLGHVTVCGDDLEMARTSAGTVVSYLRGDPLNGRTER
ncbi:MAG: ATP-grasp domain-containing protein [Micrococcales bacterium]|nr:ATP-grasp domain-containing protein [Micrococcales bacterium]